MTKRAEIAQGYLNISMKLSQELEDATESLKRIEALRRNITASLSVTAGVSGGSVDRHKDDDVQQRMDDLKSEIRRISSVIIKHEEEVQRYLNQVESNIYRKLLRSVYLDGMTLKEASDIVGFSYDYTRKLHILALEQFADVHDKVSA